MLVPSIAGPRDAGLHPRTGVQDAGPPVAGPQDAGPHPIAGVQDAGPPPLLVPPITGVQDAIPPIAGPRDAGPPLHWRAQLMFVMVALARSPCWRAASFVGTVCTVSTEPSAAAAAFAGALVVMISAGPAGGGRGGLASSRRGFQRCYLLKQETFAPLPSPPPPLARDEVGLCWSGCTRTCFRCSSALRAPMDGGFNWEVTPW